MKYISIVILGFVFGFYFGGTTVQDNIENRAKKIKKEKITHQELEKIIFNKIQL